MDIISIVNHYWPNTIARFAMNKNDMPKDSNPTSFMGGWVILIDGAALPSEADVNARQLDYAAYMATQSTNSAILQQITSLEKTITQRRIREAISGIDNGWLANAQIQIEALRQQLQF